MYPRSYDCGENITSQHKRGRGRPRKRCNTVITSSSEDSQFTEAPETLKPPPHRLFIFPNGDIELLVTFEGKEVVGSVNKVLMVAASPCWRDLLIRHWDQTTPVTQVDCRQDNAIALLILLRLVHLQFWAVPDSVGESLYLRILILVHRYRCGKLVIDWHRLWKKQYRQARAGSNNGIELSPACKVLKLKAVISITKRIVLYEIVPSDLSLDGRSVFLMPATIPDFISAHIYTARIDIINKLLDIIYRRYDELTSDNGLCIHNSEVCNEKFRPYFSYKLWNLYLIPKRQAEKLKEYSVMSLAEVIKGVNIMDEVTLTQTPAWSADGKDHRGCIKLEFEKQVDAALGGVEVVIQEDEEKERIYSLDVAAFIGAEDPLVKTI